MLLLTNRSAALAEFEGRIWHLNNEYLEKYVEPAEDHVLDLKAQAIKLEK